MTKIVGHIVTKNEADRWLDSCLAWNTQFLDALHVYDDRSTDQTVEVAVKYTPHVIVRPSIDVPFGEDESQFRQAAWDSMGQELALEKGDWIFCFDADEFLVGNHIDNARTALESLIEYAEKTSNVSVAIHRPEIWDADSFPFKQRVDGYWAKDAPIRLVRWKPKGVFKNDKLGCGSVPSYGLKGAVKNLSVCSILHLGYSIKGEAQRKHSLYSGVSGNAHSEKHINSIIEPPVLEEWNGPEPVIWRGVK